jgi:hypothetical protein
MFYFNPDLAVADQFEEGDEAFDSYNLEDDDGQNNVEVLNIPYNTVSYNHIYSLLSGAPSVSYLQGTGMSFIGCEADGT